MFVSMVRESLFDLYPLVDVASPQIQQLIEARHALLHHLLMNCPVMSG